MQQKHNQTEWRNSCSKSQSRQPISTSTKGYEMTVNNLPKFLILLVGLLCLTALMIADKIDMASGVPMLTMIIGYSIGNGVNARQGNEPTNVFGAKPKK
jgi:hypothetical protein